MSGDQDDGADRQTVEVAASGTSTADDATPSSGLQDTSSSVETREDAAGQTAHSTPTAPAQTKQMITSSDQVPSPREPPDVSIWLVPAGAIFLIAGAGKLGGVFWGAATLVLVVTIAVAVVVNTAFPEHRKQFAVAVGILVGIALMFILIAQRPDILTHLGIPTPSARAASSASPASTP